MNLRLDNPIMIARDGDTAVLISAGEESNPDAPAQLWTPENGYSPVKPLQAHIKFLYAVEDVIPAQPWQEPPTS